MELRSLPFRPEALSVPAAAEINPHPEQSRSDLLQVEAALFPSRLIYQPSFQPGTQRGRESTAKSWGGWGLGRLAASFSPPPWGPRGARVRGRGEGRGAPGRQSQVLAGETGACKRLSPLPRPPSRQKQSPVANPEPDWTSVKMIITKRPAAPGPPGEATEPRDSRSQVCPPPGTRLPWQEAGRRGRSWARPHTSQHREHLAAEDLPRRALLEVSSCLAPGA